MDILTLKGLRYEAGHGYYEEERRKGNVFEVDLIIWAALKKAGQTDDLEDTIDYQKAEKIVSSIMNGPSKRLIESLVYEIGVILFEKFETFQKLEVKIRKMNPPLPAKTNYSEVSMTWQR